MGPTPGATARGVPTRRDQGVQKAPSRTSLLGARDEVAIQHLLELGLVADYVGPGVQPYEDVDEEVDPIGGVVLALHRRGNVAVEREWNLGVAGFHQVAGDVSGDVDLEPVLGERIVPQD